MARKKQNSGNPKPTPPTAASKRFIPRRDMRRRPDPFAITAPVDETARRPHNDGYVTFTNTDRYGALVPAWQESQQS
jgi:hypothetical protein